MGHEKSWYTYYQEHGIEAIVRGRGQIYELKVDGLVLKNAVVTGGYWPTIHARHSFSNIEREIEVRFATKIGTVVDLGCQIFVDGGYIGVDKHTEYPTLQKISKKTEKGFINYFFSIGLFRYGVISITVFAIQLLQLRNLMYLTGLNLTEILIIDALLLFSPALLISCLSWHQTKLTMKNLLRFEEKWK